ncbi:MAG: tetratricopeptide repeat protein [Paraprevotella sp.]|nr:tetratricopeptide repeat protein [Paraprevotella sp.]
MCKNYFLILSLSAVAAFTSCKKLGELSADNFTVTPTPLEVVAGKVPATIDGKFPEKYMKKKAVVTVTPVLKYEGGEVKGQSATFQGEKVEGNDQTISYKVGGTYTMKASFDYVPAMQQSDLYLQFDAKVGKKTVTVPEVKIGYGVVSTSQLLKNTLASVKPSLAADTYQRIIAEKQEANIKFLIQQAAVRQSELKSDNVKDFVKMMKQINDEQETMLLNNIEVSAYASPDGALDLNTRLAEQRQGNSEKYLQKELKKLKMEAQVDAKYTAEDWDGFQQLVAASNIQDKEVIVRVLSMYNDPEEREAQIKNMSVIFKELADQILPELRRARLTLNYMVVGRSDVQIEEQFKEDASQLSVEEMLYGANLDFITDKEAWYKKTTEIYPNDFRAYNNLGLLAYEKGDFAKAEEFFNKAKAVKADAAEVNANLALIELGKGNVAVAETYLGKAAGAEGLNEALACLNIAKGSYGKAASTVKEVASNSAALAQILNKDYAAAKNTLENVANKDAYTSYLKAVVAARTKDAAAVSANLRDAFVLDASLINRAKKDLEFAAYKSIIDAF